MACKGLAFSVTPLGINRSLPSSSSPSPSPSPSSFTVVSSFLPRTFCSSSSSSFPQKLRRRRRRRPSSSVVYAFFPRKNDKQEEEEEEEEEEEVVVEYKFPDPIPEFAEAETEKFRVRLMKKLYKKQDIFGDSFKEVVQVCTEIFSTFMHTEYQGPGTLLVTPFIDMADTITEKGLPGSSQAARAAVVWAQKHVDKDWNEWTGSEDDPDDNENNGDE